MELTAMAGIGPARAEALRAMGIISLRDLLYTLPERYEDYSTVSPCNTVSQAFCISWIEESYGFHRGRKRKNAGLLV